MDLSTAKAAINVLSAAVPLIRATGGEASAILSNSRAQLTKKQRRQNAQAVKRVSPGQGGRVSTISVVRSAPSSMSNQMRIGSPTISILSDSVRISHYEVLGVLSGINNGLARAIIPINNELTPWLTAESQQYGKWRPESIRVSYTPSCSSSTNGSIAIAPIYDTLSQNERTNAGISSIMSAEGAVSGPVWSNTLAASWDCSKIPDPWMEVLPQDPAIARRAIGFFYVITDGPHQNLGRLVVNYTFRFAYNRPEFVADVPVATRFSVDREVLLYRSYEQPRVATEVVNDPAVRQRSDTTSA